ncbi:MAG: hypothetical protein ACXVBW_08405 [Bdellovibrionota bacterium]
MSPKGFALTSLLALTLSASALGAEAPMPGAAVESAPAATSRFDLTSINQGKLAIGVTYKELITTAGNKDLTSFAGLQMITYRNYNFYVGGAAFGGILTSGADKSTGVGYGGLLMGWSAPLFGTSFDYDMNLLVGLGGASTGIGITAEPGIYVARRFAKYFRASLGGGYLFWPVAPAISGIALSLKFEI